MNELFEIVKAYLDDSETDYALMIEGPWGCGKTFYWKNRIVPEIEIRDGSRTQLKNDPWFSRALARNKMKPVYVSLYGLSHPDDIDRAILLSLRPWLGHKATDVVSGVARPFLKAVHIDLDSVRFDPKTWTNLHDVILCFDDLERCSIGVADVLGRINQYVEHEKVKTIVLCNESAIRETERKAYRKIKEKVIGKSIRFKLDHGSVLDAMVKTYSASEAFHQFLIKTHNSILELFQRSASDNIRILRHGLANLHTVFTAIDAEASYADAARQAMIRMTLPLTFEYELHRANKRQIGVIATYTQALEVAMHLTDDREPHWKKHEVRYFGVRSELDPSSQAIADLITTGWLDRQLFKKDLEQAYAPPGSIDAAFQALSWTVWQLSDDDFKGHIQVLLDAVAKRDIRSLQLYFQLMTGLDLFARLNLVPMTRTQIVEMLTLGVVESIAADSINFVRELDDHLAKLDGEADADLKAFREFLVVENAKLKRNYEEKKGIEFLTALQEASADGIRKLIDRYFDVSIMDVVPVEQAADAIVELPNKAKSLLRSVMRKRYNKASLTPVVQKELGGLKLLRDALAARLGKRNEIPRPMGLVVLHLIVDDLSKAIDMLSAPAPEAPVKMKDASATTTMDKADGDHASDKPEGG